MNHQRGGHITSSFVGQIIIDISSRANQTPEYKRTVNRSITNTGHGSIFLGSSSRLEGGDRNIRMLLGAHFARQGQLKIDTFGGRCNRNEMTLDTVVRETIEEIFNFKPEQNIITRIREFLNTNTELYYILSVGRTHTAYSYIFDVSVLGDFIRIIDQLLNEGSITGLVIPLTDGYSNIMNYLDNNVKFSDSSSFSGRNRETGPNCTINLVEFIKERYISRSFIQMQRQMNINTRGLNEIKYLSFTSLSKLLASVPSGRYNLWNFNKNRRENIIIKDLLQRILNKDLLRYIAGYS